MSQEKRKSARYESRLFLNLESVTKDTLGRGVVTDVSLTGFGVETEAELNHGGEYICHLEIPLTIKAKVIRREIKGQMKRYGLRFVGQGFIDKVLLKKLLHGPLKTGRLDV